MKTELAFWDTSALIPLCCRQTASPRARQIKRRFPALYAWWGSSVEVHSAIARLSRESAIDEREKRRSLRRWSEMLDEINVVAPTSTLLAIAIDIPETYAIRALDAFQLGAALVWCNQRPRNRPFVTADVRLGEAAGDAGFNVISLL